MAGIATVSALSAILKEFYLPPVVAQLNNETILLHELFGGGYSSVSWKMAGGGRLWVPQVRSIYDPWERHIRPAADALEFSLFTSIIEVPVMDTTIEKIIRDYLLPVLSQHNVELRRQPITVGTDFAVTSEGFKMMCMRCGHVGKFKVEPLSMLRDRSRETVEKFLRDLVDEHFRPWEQIKCATEGTLRTLVAEWLTLRLAEHGTLFDHQLRPMLLEDGFEHWDPEFVLLVAEGLDFVDDLTQYESGHGKMLLLPKLHPLAPR